jgi:hypothetical protein
MGRCRHLALLAMACALALGAARAPLLVTVWPRVAIAPAVVLIEMRVEPADENRALEITVESGEYFRASTIPLAGARAARVHSVQYRSLPAGSYEVAVAIRGPSGRVRASFLTRIEVM